MSQLEAAQPSRMWQIAACGLGLVSVLLMYFTKRTLLSTCLFCITAAVVILGLIQLLSTLRGAFRPLAVFLLPVSVICFFFMAYLLRVMPYLGYLGQTMDVLTPIWLIALVVGAPLLWFGQSIRVRQWGMAQLLVGLQALLIVTQVCAYGISQWLPGWQARGLDTQVIDLGEGIHSAPLVEGQSLWMARYSYQGNHTFDQIDLSSGRVLQRIPLPSITPEQLGRPDWVDAGMALRIWQAAISRINEHQLQVQYPTQFALSSYEPVEQPISIRQTVDLDRGQVLEWKPLLGEAAQAGFAPGPDMLAELEQLRLQLGEYQVSWVSGELHFRSPRDHYFLRCAWPSYLLSLDERSILMGAGSELFIIRIK